MTFTKRSVLVTGASGGMGAAIVRKLAKADTHVLLHHRSEEKGAADAAAAIIAEGGRADLVKGDLSTPEGIAQIAAETRRLLPDGLDVLVLSAGVAYEARIEEETFEAFDRLFAINVRAPLFLLQKLLPAMKKGGSVIFFSSIGARRALGERASYTASKGAIETLVRSFAASLGGRGIRVNAVAPGVINTPMSAFVSSEEGRALTLSMQALQRVGQPDDIAAVVAFLASDEARWITGAIISADGGTLL